MNPCFTQKHFRSSTMEQLFKSVVFDLKYSFCNRIICKPHLYADWTL